MAPEAVGEPLRVITVCGVGMGSSLILRMTAEKAFQELGVRASFEATDASSARSMYADVIIGQGMHTSELEGLAPVVVSITNFLDVQELKEKLAGPLQERGWLAQE